MPEEYIKRDDALQAVWKRIQQIGDSTNPYVLSIRQAVREVPAADVAPVRHGEFIGTEFAGYCVDGVPVYSKWECSECWHEFEGDEPHYKYCPNCGAKNERGE